MCMCPESSSFRVAHHGLAFHRKAEKGVIESSGGVSAGHGRRLKYHASMAECPDPGSGAGSDSKPYFS